jgi:hypothetical protein
MVFDKIIVSYDLELEALYKIKIKADPKMFDSDKQSHGYTCSRCSRSLGSVKQAEPLEAR